MLTQKDHEPPSDATCTNPNIHNVLFNTHLLANIMIYVESKGSCLQVNKAWNNIIGQEYYRAKLKIFHIYCYYDKWRTLDDIVRIFQQSILNQQFESGLAHVLKQKDTTICLAKKEGGGFPIASITQLNTSLNPNVTDRDLAGASTALALDVTESAIFQNGILREFDIFIEEYTNEEMAEQLALSLQSIVEFLPEVKLSIDYHLESDSVKILAKLCSNGKISDAIKQFDILELLDSDSVEGISRVLDVTRPKRIVINTGMGVNTAPIDAILPHHVLGTDVDILIHRLNSAAALHAFSDLLCRLKGVKLKSLYIRLEYDTGSLSEWLDVMWQQPWALPAIITIFVTQSDEFYYTGEESVARLIRSQMNYKSDIEAFNLRHLDPKAGQYEMRIESKYQPIESSAF